jgi:2-C-methyl-D-erythritol 4-phosphate cytidylyltransferase
VDKLFLEVAGRPVVAHAWMRFDAHPEIHRVVLVVRDGLRPAFEEIAASMEPAKPFVFAPGGAERQDSVWNGLAAVDEDDAIVAVQDGARPCTSADTIARCLGAASRTGASVAAQPAVDTIKESDGQGLIARHLERSRLWAVQTPQCFRAAILRRALAEVRARGLSVTDDTAACAAIGQPVELVHCPDPNPKVTVPGDLPLLEHWLVVRQK